METTMNELIHFIQKNYKDEHHSEILSEAYRLLKKEKEHIKEHFEKGFLRSKTALLNNVKAYSDIYYDGLNINKSQTDFINTDDLNKRKPLA